MHSRPSPLEKECDHEEDICHFGRPEPRRWYCCSRGSGQRVIDLAGNDPTMGNLIAGSPLALAIASRGAARCCLAIPGWKEDFALAVEMVAALDVTSRALVLHFAYFFPLVNGVLLPDAIFAQRAHIALRRHGQEVCKRSAPRCEVCPLRRLCTFYLRTS